MILTKEVEMKVNSNNVEYYKSLGYDIPMRKASESIRQRSSKEFVYDLGAVFMVKVEDLPICSKEKVIVRCDICKENETPVTYHNYISAIERSGSYACKNCRSIKRRITVEQRYDVTHVSQLDSVKEKRKKTMLLRYGVENAAQNDIIKDKMRKTMIDRYDVPYSSQSPELRNKAIETWIQTLGVDNPSKASAVQEKVSNSFHEHSTQRCSKQQMYLFELYSKGNIAELNFPILYYNVDICLTGENFVIEYDGGGHTLSVTTGQITQEMFEQKEIIRNNVIKKAGYKQMRIISSKDKLPSDKILLQMLEQAKQYFSDYPEHSWIEYNIDTSSVRNAEHKDGVFFDYGELRKIK